MFFLYAGGNLGVWVSAPLGPQVRRWREFTLVNVPHEMVYGVSRKGHPIGCVACDPSHPQFVQH